MLKTETVTCQDEKSRDFGKVYLIKEMPASRVEKWAFRALAALAKANIFMPEGVDPQAGIAGIATAGFNRLGDIPWADAEPLLDEMMTCVSWVPDPSRPMVVRHPAGDDAIEDLSTRLMLRKAIFQLHTNFSTAGDQSTPLQGGVLNTSA